MCAARCDSLGVSWTRSTVEGDLLCGGGPVVLSGPHHEVRCAHGMIWGSLRGVLFDLLLRVMDDDMVGKCGQGAVKSLVAGTMKLGKQTLWR